MKLRIRFPFLVLGIGLLAAVYLWEITGRDAPRCRWQVGSNALGEPFVEISAGTPVSLHLDLPFPAHAYVASHNPTTGTIALFPSPWLRTDKANPLSAGSHRLPGTTEGKELQWPAPDVLGPTSFMLVVSPARLPELEELFSRIRQVGNMAFADGSLHVSAPRDGGMAVVPERNPIPSPILQAAADALVTMETQAMVPLPEDSDNDQRPIYVATFRLTVVE